MFLTRVWFLDVLLPGCVQYLINMTVTVDQLVRYAKGELLAHVLALRINTDKLCELVVSDFTANASIEDLRIGSSTIGPHKQLRVLATPDRLLGFARLYEEHFGSPLFLQADVALSQNSGWIDVAPKLCLARITVTVTLSNGYLVAQALRLETMHELPRPLHAPFSRLWQLCLTHCPAIPPSVAERVLPYLEDDDADATRAVLATVSLSAAPTESEVSIKSEASVKSEGESEVKIEPGQLRDLRDLLAPATQPGQHPLHLLTQPGQHPLLLLTQFSQEYAAATTLCDSLWLLEDSQPRPSQPLDSQPPPPSPSQFQASSSQRSQPRISSSLPPQGDRLVLDASAVATATAPGTLSVRTLAKLPLHKHHGEAYTVSATIVGSVPEDVAFVCTKRVEDVGGQVQSSDPRVEALELIVTDAPEGELDRTTAISVYVPREEVPLFFGFADIEQLYISLTSVREQFERLFSHKRVLLNVSVGTVDGRPAWTFKRVTLAQLVTR